MALFTVDNPPPPQRDDWEYKQVDYYNPYPREKGPMSDPYNPHGRCPPPLKERTSVVTVVAWTVAIMLLIEFAAVVGLVFLMEYMS